ncbi:MAG: HAD hydrolase-like protein [Christensenellaceae bacterium]
MKYKAVLFDFDGTLIDSSPGILDCAKQTIIEMGAFMPDDETIKKFIGPPLSVSFINICKMNETVAKIAVEKYREKYRATGMYEAEIYDGIKELLIELCDAGVVCAIASVKQEVIVRETILHFGLAKYFAAICGTSKGKPFSSKIEIVNDALERTNTSAEDAIMIGDSEYDAVGAQGANVDFCAAMWGFGFDGIQALSPFRCRYIAQDVESLKKFLCE